MRNLFAIAFLTSTICAAKPIERISKGDDAPCGKVVVVKFSSDKIEVVLTPVGGRHNRGEEFKKGDFDLSMVSHAALQALDSNALLFCVQLSKNNSVEYWVTK